MKVIQIMPEFTIGGAEIMAETLSYELKKLGCDVIAVSLFNMHTPITDRLEKNGIEVKYFGKKPGLDVSQIKKLCKFFKQENPDVVHTHRNAIQYGAVAAILASVPVIVHTVHNLAKKETGKLQRMFNKILFKKCGVIPVSLSKLIQDSIVEEYKIKQENTPVILNGMPLDKYHRKMDYTIKGDVKIIHVGRFMEQKNHKGLIKAFKIVCDCYPSATLNLFGTGELEDEIKELVKAEGIGNNVNFNGVSHNIADELAKNDIFCLPSNYEGVPLTLIEAMASAMPIVATDVGGVSDMLRNNIDAIITENDIDHISSGIIELIKSEDLRKKMGESAFLRSETFSSEFMCEEYYKLYNK